MRGLLDTPNRIGVAATVAAGVCFISNDALVKHVSAQLASAQLIFIRGVFACLLLLAIGRFLLQQRDFSAITRVQVWRRALVDALASWCYLTALAHLPIGNATAINMAAPIFIAAGAALWSREPVGGRRWWLILLGFVAVMMIIQPRAEGFNAYAWLALAATLLHAARDLLTRSIPAGIPSFVVTLATALAVTLFSGAYSLLDGWKPLTLNALASLALASLFLAAAYFLIIKSMRQGEMSVIAPFRYSGLPFALLLGFVFWGEVPNLLAWSGIALLVVAGILMMRVRN